MIIDLHSHYVPRSYLKFVRDKGATIGRELVTHASGVLAIKDQVRDFPLTLGFFDEDVKLADMARQGIDCSVVSVPPFMFHYELSADKGTDLSREYNDEALALAARHPGRFAAMATLPLQDPTLAVDELERVVKLGIRGVEIGASIHQRELDDPVLDIFWQAAERLGVLVFIHPMRPPGRERMAAYHLFNVIGFLAETTLAATRMIFAGVLDRYPRLNICLAHTGGMLLWIEGRLDQAHATIEACRKNIERKPSEYLTRFYYDTITYRPRALAYAIESVCASRIMLGSDYPFAIAEDDPVGSINAVPGLSAADRLSILGGGAAALLGLKRAYA